MPYPLTVDNYELIVAAVLVSQAINKNRSDDIANLWNDKMEIQVFLSLTFPFERRASSNALFM